MRWQFLVPLLFLSATDAAADIYGYVDEHGIAHLSPVPLDARYYLFKKEAPPPPVPPAEPVAAMEPPALPAPPPLQIGPTGKRYADVIRRAADEVGLDAALIHAVVAAESGYDARAVSRKGAVGLMQLMPATASRYRVKDIWDPLENVRGGARYLRDLLVMFKDNLDLALAAYNAGEGAVIAAGHRIPPYRETRHYVPKVRELIQRYRGGT